MLSEMISPQLTACLNNLVSLPASSLSQAECLASSRPTSPKSMVPSKVQKALPARRIRGGSLVHEPSRVQSKRMFVNAPVIPKMVLNQGGERQVVSLSTALPGSGPMQYARKVLTPTEKQLIIMISKKYDRVC